VPNRSLRCADLPVADFIVHAWPLIRRQWAEFEAERGDISLDLLAFAEFEQRRAISATLLLEDETPIGYVVVTAHDDIFSFGTKTALVLALYVVPERRTLTAALTMLRVIDEAATRLGCSSIVVASRDPAGGPDLSRLLTRAGYRPIETWYRKATGHVDAQYAQRAETEGGANSSPSAGT